MLKIDFWGVELLIVVCVLIPWFAVRSRRRLVARGLPISRPVFFWQSIITQVVLYGLALVAAARNEIILRLVPRMPARSLVALALLAAAVALLHLRWRSRLPEEKQRLYAILPHDRKELLPYVLLCSVAAVSEEVVYRGAGPRLFLRQGFSVAVAVTLMALAFAAAHALQGWRSAAAIFLIALAFHGVVIYCNALLPAIAVHFAYDIYAGVMISRWMRGETEVARLT